VLVPTHELARGPEARWLSEHASEARCRLSSGSLITLAHAVARGLGVCPLPTNLASMVEGTRLVRMLPEIQPRPVWLVMPPELKGTPRVRAAANAITAELRKHLA
jgi:DNA-binding transcriptional LysR family regulator